MLEDASGATIEELLFASGKTVAHVNLEDIPSGSLIRFRTTSGNTYLLETIDPSPLAHVARYSPHKDTLRTGYLGTRSIAPPFVHIGEVMHHGKYTTHPVEEIVLFSS